MNFRLSEHKKLILDFRKLTLFFVCVYVISIYLGDVSGIISSIGSVSLIAMSGCAVMTILTERKMKVNSYVIWYALFVFICVISSLYAPIGTNVLSSLYSLIVILVIGVVLSVAIKEKKDIEIIFALIVIASSLLMIYLFLSGYISEYQASDKFGRFGHELTGNANAFAAIFMIAACASIYFFFSQKKITTKILSIVPFFLQLYGLVLAGSRKNILIPFIMLYLISLQIKNRNGRHNVLIKTLIAVIGVFICYWLSMNVPFLYENIGYRFETIVDYGTGDASNVDASSEIRMKMIGKAIELWKQKPILGNGVNAFSTLSGFGAYAHNNFVEILCNQGIVGLSVYYIYYIVNVCKLFNNKMDTSVFKFFGIAFIVSEVLFEFGQITYYMVPSHIMLMLISIYNSKKE